MCLDIKWWSIKRIALKDIECFKVVNIDSQLKNIYRTPYQKALVQIGETYTSNIIRTKLSRPFSKRVVIDKALHSFANENDARAELPFKWQRVVIRCIIPRGSRYYVGKWHIVSKYKCYASNKLKYIEKI